MNVTSCTFIANHAGYGGGAIVTNQYTTNEFHFCSFIGNTATYGNFAYNWGSMNATNNWWGNNTNPATVTNLIYNYGGSDVSSWIVMNITVDPNSILNGANSTVTVDLLHDNTGAYHDPLNGHIPDGTLVTFTSTLGSFNPTTATIVNGIATVLFTANQTGTGNLTATTDNQTVTQLLTVNPASYLYLNTTTSKANPTVGETFVLTYKLSNRGPDNATNVTVSFQIPVGLEFVDVTVDNGTWTYNPKNRTVTWNLTNVEVGDPYLYLTVKVLGTGSYTITPTITSDTYNRNTDSLTPFTVNVKAQNNSNADTVNAASTTKTVPMQTTGMPITGLVLAILAVLGGTLAPRKK